MDHIEGLYHDLSRIAASMEALKKEDDARAFYDLLSGSLVWSDELPKNGAVSLDCLRFVLKYRTGLIVGEPQPSFELFWQESIRRFPNWIGFSVDRTTQNEALTAYYLQERKRV
jgi:hypothetical protein